MVNIMNLLAYLNSNGFLRKEMGQYLFNFIVHMKEPDIDESDLEFLKKELDLNYYRPLDSPQCHWLTGTFKENRIYLVAFAILTVQDMTSIELDRMVWVYLKINERLAVKNAS